MVEYLDSVVELSLYSLILANPLRYFVGSSKERKYENGEVW
jgi:hypothetical protein